MRTQNLVFVVLSIFFMVQCINTLKEAIPFSCNPEFSNFLAAQLFKRREDPLPEESECEANETLHIVGVTDYCREGCDSGCVCKPGYIRTNKKGCILIEENGMKCNKSEVIVCGKAECEKFCDLAPDPLCAMNYFSCGFSYNCYCKEGYIRVSDGSCIPISACPTKLYEKPAFENLLF